VVEPPPIEVVIALTEAGERLDHVLVSRGVAISRSILQRWIVDGRVTVDGGLAASKHRVRPGARVLIHPAPPPPSTAVAEDIPLAVLFEDEHIVVIDKAAGMVVHPAPGHAGGTLVNALLHRSTVRAEAGNARPGIVHRLDKDTSGVLVVARTPLAHAGLVPQFRAHSIERRYLAIAVGRPASPITFDTLHGRHRVDRKRFTSKTDRGKRAVTHLRVVERLHGSALVECSLETGRTHQIRVHLAEHGFPVLGDKTYGPSSRDPHVMRAAAALGRQGLHAAALGFNHPVHGEPLRFVAPLPADFERALGILRSGP